MAVRSRYFGLFSHHLPTTHPCPSQPTTLSYPSPPRPFFLIPRTTIVSVCTFDVNVPGNRLACCLINYRDFNYVVGNQRGRQANYVRSTLSGVSCHVTEHFYYIDRCEEILVFEHDRVATVQLFDRYIVLRLDSFFSRARNTENRINSRQIKEDKLVIICLCGVGNTWIIRCVEYFAFCGPTIAAWTSLL